MNAQRFQRGIAKARWMRRWADRKGGRIARLDPFDRSQPGTLACRVDEWLESLTSRGYSPRSIQTAHWALRSFLFWAQRLNLTAPETITHALLEGWHHDLARKESGTGKPLAATTQLARLGYVQRFFGWMCRSGLLLANPAANLDLPRKQPQKLPKALSPDQVEAVLAVPDVSDALGVRDRAILEVFYSTAIRRRELVLLDSEDVRFSSGVLLVRHGKGSKMRFVPLDEATAGWLQRYLTEARPQLEAERSESALFLTGYGQRFSVAGLGNLVRQLLNAAGIRTGGCCHLFRHTCATRMLEGGADIRVIQQLLGHARLDTTAIYAEVSIDHLKDVHARCHPHGRAFDPTEEVRSSLGTRHSARVPDSNASASQVSCPFAPLPALP